MNIEKDEIYAVTLEAANNNGIDMDVKESFMTSSYGKDITFTVADSDVPVPVENLILWEDDAPTTYSLTGFSDDLHLWVFSPIDIIEVSDKYVIFEQALEQDKEITRKRLKLSKMSRDYKKDLKNYLTK